jgi:hypothetical protein
LKNNFQVGDTVLLHLNNERFQWQGKKIKSFRYEPFEIPKKVGNNAYIHNVPPYVYIYLVENVERLKIYGSSMLNEDEEG